MAITNVDRTAQVDLINGKTAASKTKVEEMQDRFMKLLVTQLRNQDPTNPMQNAELTSQLAQMSTVEGVTKLNTTLDSLLKGYQASQTMQAAALVGRQVLTDGDTIELNKGLGGAAVELKEPVDKLKVRILNDYGQEVRSIDLGAKPEGVAEFLWDGRDANGQAAPDGGYWYTVEAERGGQFVQATPLAVTTVRSVLINNGIAELDTAGLGTRQFDQVRRIF